MVRLDHRAQLALQVREEKLGNKDLPVCKVNLDPQDHWDQRYIFFRYIQFGINVPCKK